MAESRYLHNSTSVHGADCFICGNRSLIGSLVVVFVALSCFTVLLSAMEVTRWATVFQVTGSFGGGSVVIDRVPMRNITWTAGWP